MKKIKLVVVIIVMAIFLIACKPVQEATLMDDTWYVMTETDILMLCETDESQKEYLEAIKLLKGDSHSVEAAIEKLKSMEQTVEVKNALGIGAVCLAKFEEAEKYFNSAYEMAEKDSHIISILNNQIYIINCLDKELWSAPAMDKYNILSEKEISNPIQALIVSSNWLMFEEKIDTVEDPAAILISGLEKLLKKEKNILGSNQMVGIFNYLRLASLYIEMEIDIQKGIDYLNEAMKLNAETYRHPIIDIAVYGNLSDVYASQKEYDRSLEYSDKCIEKEEAFYIEGHPYLIGAYLSKGLTLYRAGRYDDAIDSYEKTIQKMEPNDVDLGTACINMGLSYYKKGEMEKAIEYFTKSYGMYSANGAQQEYIDMAKDMLQRMYDEGGYSEKAPDFDKWMQEQIQKYGTDVQ